jgi:homoserine dehydrogenase
MRVALLGLGTVGAAVAARLLDSAWRAEVAARGVEPPELVAVGVRDPGRRRSVELPSSVDRTDDLQSVVERGDVDVMLELLGGLEGGDTIVEFGGQKIGGLEDFDLALRLFKPGDEVAIVVLRDGERVTLKVTLAMPR